MRTLNVYSYLTIGFLEEKEEEGEGLFWPLNKDGTDGFSNSKS